MVEMFCAPLMKKAFLGPRWKPMMFFFLRAFLVEVSEAAPMAFRGLLDEGCLRCPRHELIHVSHILECIGNVGDCVPQHRWTVWAGCRPEYSHRQREEHGPKTDKDPWLGLLQGSEGVAHGLHLENLRASVAVTVVRI